MPEKWQLYFLRKDGSKDSVYLSIKNKKFLFGSSEDCTLRIYIKGIYPKHCVLTIEDQGKAYLEPLHPSALTLVNGIKIKHKVSLSDKDVITLSLKKFQFAYPLNSLFSSLFFERFHLKQMESAQKFEILTQRKNLEISQLPREYRFLNINYIPNKLVYIANRDISKKIPEYFLKFVTHDLLNISYENINIQVAYSGCSDKPLIKYMDWYDEESSESRRISALKLFEFLSFIREMINMNEEYRFDLLQIFESVWNYSIARGIDNILFLLLKNIFLKGETTVYKDFLRSRIPSYTVLESNNHIDPIKSSASSDCKYQCNSKQNEQKQDQHSSKNISMPCKKRISLAGKRYNLRRKKNIVMTKSAEIGSEENLELLDLGKENITELMNASSGDLNAISKQRKPKKRNKKQNSQNTEKENITELMNASSGDLNAISKQRKLKKGNKKQNSQNTDNFTQGLNTQEVLHCQRITRSMAKKHF